MVQEALSVETKRVPWWLDILEGVITLVLGILVLLLLAKSEAVKGINGAHTITLLGIWWLVFGALNTVGMFAERSVWVPKLVAGILGLAGLFVIRHPIWTGALDLFSQTVKPDALGMVLGICGIIVGLILLFLAWRGGSWVTGLLGLLSLVFAILILIGKPFVEGPAFVWIVGILAVLGGLAAIVGGYLFKPQPAPAKKGSKK